MSNASPQDTRNRFRWRSWLGVAVVIFLLYGLFNFFAAIFIPVSLHQNGVGKEMGTVVSVAADSKVLGRPLATLAKDDPRLNDYIVSYMDTMCWMMMAFAISLIGIVWFGLRRGQTWALWASAASSLSFIPYLAAWTSIFSRYGVSTGDIIMSFSGFWPMLTAGVAIAIVSGWAGLRKLQAASGISA